MKVIGITGGIGSGKSTISKILKDEGFKVIDADQISRKVIDENEKNGILEKLILKFGKAIIRNGQLDRKKLASLAFKNENTKKSLDDIMLPCILKMIQEDLHELLVSGGKTVFIDAPLLFEAGLDKLCDETWLVSADEKLRIKRVIKRDNVSADEVRARMRFQMPEEDKRKLASFIFDNSKSEKELENQVKNKLKEIE